MDFVELDHYSFRIKYATSSPQYKNTNIANLILAVPLGIDLADEVYSLEM